MDNSILFLRRADEQDESILLEWINDNTTRQNSFNAEKISSETHENWFHQILNSDDKQLFIMMNGNVPVGQIRLEIVENCGTISYSISARYRGFGYGKTILQLLESWVATNYDTELWLIGLVKKSNEISSHIFESENYNKSESNGYVKYFKQIIPNQDK